MLNDFSDVSSQLKYFFVPFITFLNIFIELFISLWFRYCCLSVFPTTVSAQWLQRLCLFGLPSPSVCLAQRGLNKYFSNKQFSRLNMVWPTVGTPGLLPFWRIMRASLTQWAKVQIVRITSVNNSTKVHWEPTGYEVLRQGLKRGVPKYSLHRTSHKNSLPQLQVSKSSQTLIMSYSEILTRKISWVIIAHFH